MAAPEISTNAVAGVILAGGRSQRMGGSDKALAMLAGRPLVAHVASRLGPQVGPMAINANGDPARFAGLAPPVIADATTDFQGPLAGLLAGIVWASALPDVAFIATVPADTPFVPKDLVARLAAERQSADAIAVARTRGTIYPVVGLFPVVLRDDLRGWLATTSDRSVRTWLARHPTVAVDFPDGPEGCDPFFNVNTPADLAAAEAFI